jgi:hypothetical protein
MNAMGEHAWRTVVAWTMICAAWAELTFFGVFSLASLPQRPAQNIVWGTTYSAPYARELGLDARQAYLELLDELHPARLRLIAYWSEIETIPGQQDFSDLDFQVIEAEKRRVPYTIVIGQRVPRWPECHIPPWAAGLGPEERHEALERYLATVVERYRTRPYLERWQVENESNVTVFGICPPGTIRTLPAEVALVRRLSDKPVMVTGGGETWPLGLRLAGEGDVFGTSLYRSTRIGRAWIFKPLPPALYTARGNLAMRQNPQLDRVIISELQGEPWAEGPLPGYDQRYYDITMSHHQFRKNARIARETRLAEAYWWGTEWWLYQKRHGDSFYWNTAKDIFGASAR